MQKLFSIAVTVSASVLLAISTIACAKSTPNNNNSKLSKEEATVLQYGEPQNPFIGKQFIDLQEADVNGQIHSLSEYVGKGKWVLIDFWASWCGPCCGEMPNVVANYQRYHDKGFEVVGLSFDIKKQAWINAINYFEMTWINLSDLKGWDSIAAETYLITGIPANFLVDPKGKIIAANLRGEALGEALKAIFEPHP